MVILLDRELENAIREIAQTQGVAPEALAVETLRSRFLATSVEFVPRDEWERRLLGTASDCGVSLPPDSLSSEGLYD